jgi:cation efflux system protein involved in nickel and cobalt tolerance
MLERLLNATLRFSIARRWLIVAAAVVISLWGLLAVGQMPLDVFPPFAPPQVDVQTSAAGLSPEEVETRITLPIESAVNGIAGVETVRSSSKAGLSMVQVVFHQNADIYRARQAVAERLQQVTPQLPVNASAPELSPLVSPLGTILQVAFTVKGDGATSLMDLQQLVLRSYRQAILAVPGVAQVTIYGGDEQQFQVLLDPQELQVQTVSLQAVMEGVGAAMATSPGGSLIGGGQERLIRPMAQITQVSDLADTAVRNAQGQPVLLSTLAEVKRGAALKRGDASFNGKPAVVLMVTKQPDVGHPHGDPSRGAAAGRPQPHSAGGCTGPANLPAGQLHRQRHPQCERVAAVGGGDRVGGDRAVPDELARRRDQPQRHSALLADRPDADEGPGPGDQHHDPGRAGGGDRLGGRRLDR